MVCVWSALWCLRVSCRVVFRGLSWLSQFLVVSSGALGGFVMDGDDLLCRFSESEVVLSNDDELVRGSCVLSGKFCGLWVRDGWKFTKELGRPDAELWSLVECRVMCGHWHGSQPSDFLLMVKGDSFVPVKFEKSRENPTGKFYVRWATTGYYGPYDLLNGVVVMHYHSGKKVPKYLSCVNWDGFGPSDKALVERVIEHGVAALAG